MSNEAVDEEVGAWTQDSCTEWWHAVDDDDDCRDDNHNMEEVRQLPTNVLHGHNGPVMAICKGHVALAGL